MRRVKVTVEEGYRRWAETYDGYPNALLVAEEPLVRALAGDVRGLRVLDAGTGTGRHAAWLAAAGAHVTAVDASEEMLTVARTKSSAVDWRCGSLEALPVDAGAFELVVCALALEHVVALDRATDELVRALAPGGRLVVSMFHPWFPLHGVPPHFAHAPDGVEYELPYVMRLSSEYVSAMLERGLRLTAMHEPIVDEALCATLPNMRKHLGAPLGLVLAGAR